MVTGRKTPSIALSSPRPRKRFKFYMILARQFLPFLTAARFKPFLSDVGAISFETLARRRRRRRLIRLGGPGILFGIDASAQYRNIPYSGESSYSQLQAFVKRAKSTYQYRPWLDKLSMPLADLIVAAIRPCVLHFPTGACFARDDG